MDFIDLHIHSTASDGSLDPYELVQTALEKGLYAFALTDLDTVEGIPYVMEAAEGYPVHVIPGIEISTSYLGNEVHVLGYNIDWNNEFLLETLESVDRLRYERLLQICDLLSEHRIHVTIQEIFDNAESRVITRADIAKVMVIKKYVSSSEEAYDKYLGRDKPCYIPKFKLDIEDAVKLIHFAGGVCSLAYPAKYHMTDEEFIVMFRYLKRLGFKCIEAVFSDHTARDEKRFRDLAEFVGLGITGGTGFSCKALPDVSMGTGRGNLMIPAALLENLGLK